MIHHPPTLGTHYATFLRSHRPRRSSCPTPSPPPRPQITTLDGATLATLERPPLAGMMSMTMPPINVMVGGQPFATIDQKQGGGGTTTLRRTDGESVGPFHQDHAGRATAPPPCPTKPPVPSLESIHSLRFLPRALRAPRVGRGRPDRPHLPPDSLSSH